MNNYNRGDVVIATYGYNDILHEPFKRLYEYGYPNNQGGHIVYIQGETNMQDASVFKFEQLHLATDKEIKEELWA